MSQRPRRQRVTHPSAVALVVFIGMLLVLVPVLWRSIFSIREIDVIGNSFCTDSEVIAAAGIQVGDSIFAAKNVQIEESVNAHRYLRFESVTRDFFPCVVHLTVSEHVPYAKFSWHGMLVLIGDHNAVLEITPQIDMPIPVPELIGMSVSTPPKEGYEVSYKVAGQGNAINDILQALHSLGMGREVSEIHVSLPDSLYIIMVDGLQIMLGNGERMEEKFLLIGDVMPYIRSGGNMTGATLDVSTAKSADFKEAGASATPAPAAEVDPALPEQQEGGMVP